ncbi:MAG: zinc ribbon domain-containing protein [Kiritimatiellia bacterium]|jgi:putative FmdB family regulatory protein|nr:zinc ribbon domain-containing protein [Kiritimatiellia bacterium]MDP6848675.1 zinc ribbon domain-containing protein [Kiritimatiellia bacterium]
MPIYEFYCADCHTIFNFLSKAVNTSKRPPCPKCRRKLERQVSLFSMGGNSQEGGDLDELPIDESKLERAMMELAGEAEKINEDDPRQAAMLMRKFSKMTGMEFNDGMESALARLEAGEDPDKVEAEMGDGIDNEDPFILPGKKAKKRTHQRPPSRDDRLYEM